MTVVCFNVLIQLKTRAVAGFVVTLWRFLWSLCGAFVSVCWNLRGPLDISLSACRKFFFSYIFLFHPVIVRLFCAFRTARYHLQQLFSEMIHLKPYCGAAGGEIHTL